VCECGRPLGTRSPDRGCRDCERTYMEYLRMRVRAGWDRVVGE
jgi:hypothetical protein